MDHIQDSRDDYTDDNRIDSLQPLCHECHSLKTARDMGKQVSLGCDVNGIPLDPEHPWHANTANTEKSPATDGTKTAPDPLFQH